MHKGKRIELLKQCAQALAERAWAEIDLILRQFGQATTDLWNGEGGEYGYALEMLDRIADEDLVELHEYLGGVHDTSLAATPGPWAQSYLRLFLTHVSAQKAVVAQVKDHLRKFGIDGFVAHTDIEPTREWQTVIEVSLSTCDALAAFLHKGFRESNWTDQEVGFALARRIVIIPLIFDVMPYGFMARYQGHHCQTQGPASIARGIFDVLHGHEHLRPKLEEGLVTALAEARSFKEANEAARMAEQYVKNWSQQRLARMADALESNIEVTGGFDSQKIIPRLLRQHGYQKPVPEQDDVPF